MLASPGMVRENLYVAMTRGRNDNHLYLALDDVDPACNHLPGGQSGFDGRDAFAAIGCLLHDPRRDLCRPSSLAECLGGEAYGRGERAVVHPGRGLCRWFPAVREERLEGQRSSDAAGPFGGVELPGPPRRHAPAVGEDLTEHRSARRLPQDAPRRVGTAQRRLEEL
ncbi:hypothetical protein [Cellulomonas sp. ATA003]|uniref:hypothetical protein n=1 Tax=Cellulomonas sp. ATA003 TaxID=3073064 RepID=UPI0028730039|nr:hypothetical protein [Cellulomonas sp. ATA003]WNB86149.1 hypothetical protein REH70_02400 [Cellulomonas sp. ATA003]